MIRVKAVTQPRHAGGDFVELHAFLTSICTSTVSPDDDMHGNAGIERVIVQETALHTTLEDKHIGLEGSRGIWVCGECCSGCRGNVTRGLSVLLR